LFVTNLGLKRPSEAREQKKELRMPDLNNPTTAPAQAAMAEVLEFHPLADLIPPSKDHEFDELVEDVGKHGVREPIWIFKGKILDGRHRYRAAQRAGVDCPMREYLGDDPIAFARHRSSTHLVAIIHRSPMKRTS
jgi:hypothetical protein